MDTSQYTKGIHLGSYVVINKQLLFQYQSQKIFSIPLNKIQNSSIINKNEVVIDFISEIPNDYEDQLCEMRFYFPQKIEKRQEDQEEKSDQDNNDKNNSENKLTQAEYLNSLIMENAEIAENQGQNIITTLDLPLILPRGKYVTDLYKDFMRFHGTTYNYIIKYQNVKIAFLVPKPDNVHNYFILGMHKPLRQGNTQYPYIIMQFKKDQYETVKIKLKPEEIKEHYGERLHQEYSGLFYEIVSRILKALIGINIIIPGNFRSSTDQSAVKCSVKASEGYLYFLQKSCLFIPKPVIHIKIEDIITVELHRVGAQNRLFDIEFNLKNETKYVFVGIEKKEFNLISEFLQVRKITIKNVNDKLRRERGGSDDDDGEGSSDDKSNDKKSESDEDDEDFIVDDEDEEEDDDDDDDDDDEEDSRSSKEAKNGKNGKNISKIKEPKEVPEKIKQEKQMRRI